MCPQIILFQSAFNDLPSIKRKETGGSALSCTDGAGDTGADGTGREIGVQLPSDLANPLQEGSGIA